MPSGVNTVTPATIEKLEEKTMIESTLSKPISKENIGELEKSFDIERLVSQPSPVADGQMIATEPELSSFYISPVSTTNHSLADVFCLSQSQDRRFEGSTAALACAPVVQSLMAYITSEQPPSSPSKPSEQPSSPSNSVFAGIADENLRTFIDQPEEMVTPPSADSDPYFVASSVRRSVDEDAVDIDTSGVNRNLDEQLREHDNAETDAAEVDAADGKRTARKRKAVVAFDPTPVTKPRRSRAKKADAVIAPVNGEAAVALDGAAAEPASAASETASTALSDELAMVLSEELYEEKVARKKVAKKKDPIVVCEDRDLVETVAAMVDGETKVRTQKLLDKGQALIQELHGLESCADLNDERLDAVGVAASLVRACLAGDRAGSAYDLSAAALVVDGDYKSVALSPVSTEATTTVSVVVADLMRCLVCRLCHGSPLPLPALVEAVTAFVQAHVVAPLQGNSEALPECVQFVEQQLSAVLMGEEIKSLCARTAYGYKQRTVFYPTNAYAYALWRWECISSTAQQVLLYHDTLVIAEAFVDGAVALALPVDGKADVDNAAALQQQAPEMQSSLSQVPGLVTAARGLAARVKDVKSVRSRYGKAVAIVFKMADILLDQPTTAPPTPEEREAALALLSNKLAPLEEKLAKAMQEIDRAKEKRREAEKKKALKADADAAKKAAQLAKEQEKETKEREARAAKEAKEREREAKEREKETKAKEAKDKEQSKLAKQQSFFKAFLVKKESSSTPNASGSSGAGSGSGLVEEQGGEAAVAAVSAKEDALNAFVRMVRASDFHGRDLPVLAGTKRRRRRTSPRTVTLPVPVTVTKPPASTSTVEAVGGNLMEEACSYTEIQLKTFANRQITLAFHEDHRPAYVGTFQKRSRHIAGRRPLAKDWAVVNYDYDSEASYLSEDVSDAESLASDLRSEGEGGEDKLEYDAFFVQDADGMEDGLEMGMGPGALGTGKEEKLGVLFLRNLAAMSAAGVTVFGAEAVCGYTAGREGVSRCGAHSEDEVARLASCGAVLYA